MRYTSREAYEYICATGILGKRRTQAYTFLYRHGPMTALELTERRYIPGLWKRLSELEEMKLVGTLGTRACKVTGRNAMLWDVTDHIPTGPYQRPNKVSLDVLREREECAKIADRVGGLTIAKLIRRRSLKDTV